MSIGILGLETEQSAMKALEQILKTLGYRKNMLEEQYKRIMAQGPYKEVDKELHRFIGIHNLEVVSYPEWFDEFFSDFSMSVVNSIGKDKEKDIEEAFEAGEVTKDTPLEVKKLIETLKQFEQLTPKVFDTGKLPNGQKILKFCKKVFEAMTPDNKDKASEQKWYKLFESKNTSNDCEGTKIIITPSQVSFLAMSAVFDNPDYTSCQDIGIHKWNDSNIKGIGANLLDKNSLICYVTQGATRNIKSQNNLVQEKHQTMLVRMMLRLVKSETGQYYIVPDRAYPHKTYTPAIVAILKRICDNSDGKIKVGIFSSYTQEQHGTQTQFNFTFDNENVIVEEVNPVEYIFQQQYIWDDEKESDERIKSTNNCNFNSNADKCKWSGSDKFSCAKCIHNGAVKKSATYHDNMDNEKILGPRTRVRKSKINVVAINWNTEKEG